MNLPISRDTYVNSTERDGRGMTFDLFVSINSKLDQMPCSAMNQRMIALENKKGSIVTLLEIAHKNTKATVIVLIALGIAVGIAFGTVALADINIIKFLK